MTETARDDKHGKIHRAITPPATELTGSSASPKARKKLSQLHKAIGLACDKRPTDNDYKITLGRLLLQYEHALGSHLEDRQLADLTRQAPVEIQNSVRKYMTTALASDIPLDQSNFGSLEMLLRKARIAGRPVTYEMIPLGLRSSYRDILQKAQLLKQRYAGETKPQKAAS